MIISETLNLMVGQFQPPYWETQMQRDLLEFCFTVVIEMHREEPINKGA